MTNEAARDRADDVLAGLRDQMVEIAAVHEQRAALTVDAQVADGTVEVTVNAWGQLIKAVIDKSFLDDHDFDDLGDYLIEAVQTAAREAGLQVAEMMAPINERRGKFPSISDIVAGIPDPCDVIPPELGAYGTDWPLLADPAGTSVDDRYDDGEEDGGFRTFRR